MRTTLTGMPDHPVQLGRAVPAGTVPLRARGTSPELTVVTPTGLVVAPRVGSSAAVRESTWPSARSVERTRIELAAPILQESVAPLEHASPRAGQRSRVLHRTGLANQMHLAR